MENYLITKNTIAVLKNKKKTIIFDVENIRVINKTINRLLELNCNFYGSNLEGRIRSVQKMLKIKYKVPILLTETANLIVIPLNSLREETCLLVVVNKIMDYEQKNNYLKIKCLNNLVFYTNISKYCLEKMLLNTIKLNNLLNWRKI